MADLTLISDFDLAAGLKVKNLVVPKMQVTVLIKSPPAGLEKALKDEKIVGQKVIEVAANQLKKLKDTVQSAIEDLDQRYEKSPPVDVREAQDRAKTLNKVCGDIVDAQGGVIAKAALGEWNKQTAKSKDLSSYKIAFGFKMALGTISVAASVTSAALSMGTLAVTLLGTAKTLVSMASEIRQYVREIEKVEKEIIDSDKGLADRWTDRKLTAGKLGKELAAALGAPFVKSIGKLEDQLKEYNAKNGMKDKSAEKLWSKAQDLMREIGKAPKQIDDKTGQQLKLMEKSVTDLLNKINELQAESKSNDQFYDVYKARCATYDAMQGKALGRTAGATKLGVVIAGIASTADTIVNIATKLA
ncbi:MAG TPA: hypothetical protein VM689_22640 [Aliidongia sp.]|nr:hypothetical protein [Aliidongia sp.]